MYIHNWKYKITFIIVHIMLCGFDNNFQGAFNCKLYVNGYNIAIESLISILVWCVCIYFLHEMITR